MKILQMKYVLRAGLAALLVFSFSASADTADQQACLTACNQQFTTCVAAGQTDCTPKKTACRNACSQAAGATVPVNNTSRGAGGTPGG